jgi:hypothetical protein
MRAGSNHGEFKGKGIGIDEWDSHVHHTKVDRMSLRPYVIQDNTQIKSHHLNQYYRWWWIVEITSLKVHTSNSEPKFRLLYCTNSHPVNYIWLNGWGTKTTPSTNQELGHCHVMEKCHSSSLFRLQWYRFKIIRKHVAMRNLSRNSRSRCATSSNTSIHHQYLVHHKITVFFTIY